MVQDTASDPMTEDINVDQSTPQEEKVPKGMELKDTVKSKLASTLMGIKKKPIGIHLVMYGLSGLTAIISIVFFMNHIIL